ncbi:MAG: hypothetical protein ABFD92_21020 [Planctomycetaceae bacterium]
MNEALPLLCSQLYERWQNQMVEAYRLADILQVDRDRLYTDIMAWVQRNPFDFDTGLRIVKAFGPQVFSKQYDSITARALAAQEAQGAN